MKIQLSPGDRLLVNLEGSDGEFVIVWGKTSLTVEAELPDQAGRVGVIYEETWGPGRLDDLDEQVVPAVRVLTEGQREQMHDTIRLHANPDFSGKITRSTTAVDLGMDSLDVSEVPLLLEDAFGVQFPNDFEWSNVGQLEDKLAEVLQNATR